jgi:hypothetical protein
MELWINIFIPAIGDFITPGTPDALTMARKKLFRFCYQIADTGLKSFISMASALMV